VLHGDRIVAASVLQSAAIANVIVRTAARTDANAWALMREALWPAAPGEHASEIAAYFGGGNRRDPAEVFLAVDDSGAAIGFAEVSFRSHAEGCESGRVAYLEGWFVHAASRRQRTGRALIEAVEEWARRNSCTELASDTELDNEGSAAAHRALAFSEVRRIICFRKPLTTEPASLPRSPDSNAAPPRRPR
jgi:aminoglycoside 6'-N-acetyltransferase I